MTNPIDKIHSFVKFGSILGLERMELIMKELGNPQDNLRVIHVAGTNGKGSVCKYIEEGLLACGYNVGLYTSPFIEVFNERIRLGGQNISHHDLAECTDEAMAAVDRMLAGGEQSPTEFEVITAIAFLYFHRKKADPVILEVGLGGTGDSTNIIKNPLISVITSISLDHTDRLGETLEEIAAEKSGIIKEGVPVVANVEQREAAGVIAAEAYKKNARLYDISKIRVSAEELSPKKDAPVQIVSMELFETDYSDVAISMAGEHQAQNLKTALAAMEIMRKARQIKVERSALYSGLKKAMQPGRFQIVRQGSFYDTETDCEKRPMIILDGAHNEAGAEALKNTMKKHFPRSRILLVVGVLADKQVDRILDQLTQITKHIIATEPDNDRKLPATQLAQMLKSHNIDAIDEVSAAEAAELAADCDGGRIADYDVVLFAGSLYLIGEIGRNLKNEKEEG